MKVNNVKLEHVVGNKSQLPKNNLSQIAFVGKSNVGKSSIINSMVNRKALARTSNSPGKTRTINFYNVEDIFYLVDLPGYGYASASKVDIKKWSSLIENYLTSGENLKAIILLIDIRHAPGKNDKMMYDWIKYYKLKTIVVATKLDKIKSSQLNNNLEVIRKTLGMDENEILIPFSSKTKSGKEELWHQIEMHLK